MLNRKFNSLPGFRLTLGFTLFYLGVIVLIPIAGLFLKSTGLTWSRFWEVVTHERAIAAYKLTFGASLIAAFINAVFGTILAWVLVRYQFPGKRFIDALVDFPFALPTAVAGLTLANLLASNGWIGRWIEVWNTWHPGAYQHFVVWLGNATADTPVLSHLSSILPGAVNIQIQGAFSRLGVVLALTFVGMPFAVRTLQPVLEHLDRSMEEAAATLGAGRWRTFLFVIGPMLAPTVITGFALSFAPAVG